MFSPVFCRSFLLSLVVLRDGRCTVLSMDIELQLMHRIDADPDPNLDPHQSDAEFATRPTGPLRFSCDSPSLYYEPNMAPG
jgi:hypothetical protein